MTEVKGELYAHLSQDPDAGFEFLKKSSFRIFSDIENEETIREKLFEMPEEYETSWEEGEYKTFSDLESEFEKKKTMNIYHLKKELDDIFSRIGVSNISPKFQKWSSSCSRENQAALSKQCQVNAGNNIGEKRNCRQAQATKRQSCLEEVFDVTPEDSPEEQNIKAGLEGALTRNLLTGTEFCSTCHESENKR